MEEKEKLQKILAEFNNEWSKERNLSIQAAIDIVEKHLCEAEGVDFLPHYKKKCTRCGVKFHGKECPVTLCKALNQKEGVAFGGSATGVNSCIKPLEGGYKVKDGEQLISTPHLIECHCGKTYYAGEECDCKHYCPKCNVDHKQGTRCFYDKDEIDEIITRLFELIASPNCLGEGEHLTRSEIRMMLSGFREKYL